MICDLWCSLFPFKCLWSEICFRLVLKFTLWNTRFQSSTHLALKVTILQALVEPFCPEKCYLNRAVKIPCDTNLWRHFGAKIVLIMAKRKEKRKPRGWYCVPCAPNQQSCQNTPFTLGIRMYQFPSDPAVRAKWVQFVRRHRYDFKDPTSKYTSLHVCSAHFEESSYERSLSILSSLEGQDKNEVMFKKDAIPTRDTVRSNHRVPFSLMHWWPLCNNETRMKQLNSRLSIVKVLKVQRHQKMKKWVYN